MTVGRHRATRYAVGLAAAMTLVAAATPSGAATPSTLTVVVLGSGRVTSTPPGISCPGKCTATFVTGTTVTLTPAAKNGSSFRRWGGSCTGTGTCRLKATALAAVASQFTAGSPSSPGPSASVAQPGLYAGENLNGGYPVDFFVAPGGKRLLNVDIPTVYGSCPGAGNFDEGITVSHAPITAGGAFRAVVSDTGIYKNASARFTVTFAGNFRAAKGSVTAAASGSFREDFTYTANGTKVDCTSNTQSWQAVKSGPTPTKVVPQAGTYSGADLDGGYPVSFAVAPGATSLLNVAVPTVYLYCSGSGSYSDHIGIARVQIQPGGLFKSTTSATGVFDGVNARFEYTFSGSFEGPNKTGQPAVSGIYREDVTYTSNGTNYTCSSDDQMWSGTKA